MTALPAPPKFGRPIRPIDPQHHTDTTDLDEISALPVSQFPQLQSGIPRHNGSSHQGGQRKDQVQPRVGLCLLNTYVVSLHNPPPPLGLPHLRARGTMYKANA